MSRLELSVGGHPTKYEARAAAAGGLLVHADTPVAIARTTALMAANRFISRQRYAAVGAGSSVRGYFVRTRWRVPLRLQQPGRGVTESSTFVPARSRQSMSPPAHVDPGARWRR